MTGPPIVPRRDDPATWYPAGVADAAARWLTLPNGERVRVVEHTAPALAASSAPCAILLHGWGCNAFHFRRLAPALARRGVRTVAVDLRGHGLSAKPSDRDAYRAPVMADFACGVLDALGLERAGLVGHSLGGAVALDAAVAHSARVSWLTLLNPVGLSGLALSPLFAFAPVRFAEQLPAVTARLMADAALHLAYGKLGRPDPGDLEQYLFPALAPGGRRGVMSFATAYTWRPRTLQMLERIDVPVHAMFGERDRVIDHREATARLRGVRGARSDVILGAGHVLAEEVAERVADAIAEDARQLSA